MATSKSKKYAEGGLLSGPYNRLQKISNRIQNTVEAMPAYRKMQTMEKQVGKSGPTPAQIAQAQKYQQKIQTNPKVSRLINKAKNIQQRQESKMLSSGPRPTPQDQPAMMAKGGMVKKKMSAYNAVYMGKDKRK
jgi:cell fate (sporulation/competence/biofilm development) regulator YlbF (YheA/YmcA/DUF963 family)